MVKTERVETFADANVLSNVAPLLPQGHGGGDVEESGRGCITKRTLILLIKSY